MRNLVKARLDIGVQHPAITLGAEPLNLRDRVMGPPIGSETVRDRHEIGLENGFQHQLHRGLDHPIRDRRNP